MVEIKEPKEQKAPDVARIVDESMARLHDLERRLAAVQGHLSGLVNMANVLYQSQPNNLSLPTPYLPEAVGAPGGAYPFGTLQAAGFGGAVPVGGATPFASFGAGPGGYGSAPFGSGVPATGRSVSPWAAASFAQATPGISGPGLSAREFDKMPPVARVPEVNFVDAGDKYLVKMELPGVRKEDVEITVTERMVTVDAEARHELGEGTVLVGEVTPTIVYRRAITLPTSCNSTKCKANLKDGFLTLDIPKKEPTEGPRRLDVAYG